MEQQYQGYTDAAGNRASQFGNGFENPAQLSQQGNGGQMQHQPPMGYTYESYQPPAAGSKVPSNKSVSMTSSPSATPNTRDLIPDVDTPMEDADPYNRSKYSSRPSHHHRASSQFLAGEESSSAARKYSPMSVISPTLPFNPSPSTGQTSFGFPSAGQSSSRPSPTGANSYSSTQAYQSPPCKCPLLPQ